MDLNLKGRTAFVAAASRGLGRASALALAREGASVAICARGESVLRQTADEIAQLTGARVVPVAADVVQPNALAGAIDAAAEALGSLQIVVANSGGPPAGTFEELDETHWQLAFDSTLMSTVRAIRAGLPHMKRAGWGRIVVITSSSVREPIAGLLLSNTIRPGIAGLCKTLSKELAQYGITVNNVAPGSFDTERILHLYERTSKSTGKSVEEVRRAGEALIPIGRLGHADELGRVVAFLASDAASYVTGQTVLVDGGRSSAI